MDIFKQLRIYKKGGWFDEIDMQTNQMPLIKKLYANNGLNIKVTSEACPEQYEVFKDGKQVAYYRLRHGEFRVDYPNCGGKTIYSAEPSGDGIFDSDERLNYLTKAMQAVLAALDSVSCSAFRSALIGIGFKELPHFTITNNLVYDLGRNRHLSIGCLETPNEMLFICETDNNEPKHIEGLICLKNYDYDGYIDFQMVKSIITSITGRVWICCSPYQQGEQKLSN